MYFLRTVLWLVCVTFIHESYGAYGAVGMPWPLPAHFAHGNTSLSLGKITFTCVCDACKSDILNEAFQRYTDQMGNATSSPQRTTISVCVATNDTNLGPRTNESYHLSIPVAGSATIGAESVFGALHGLEVLTQLVDVTTKEITNAPITIFDHPRFGFRGLMVDTARHFLPLPFLKKVVDGLHANRLNVMHWHIVDSQSFPCGSDRFPQLAQKGAYSPRAIYSPEDMRDLVAYARLRGVRIMPEWDIPGHGSWGKGMPSIMGCDIVLDPTQNATYDFLNTFFSEMMTIFTDEYVFLGGDEVLISCM